MNNKSKYEVFTLRVFPILNSISMKSVSFQSHLFHTIFTAAALTATLGLQAAERPYQNAPAEIQTKISLALFCKAILLSSLS